MSGKPKNSERVKVWFNDVCFNELIFALKKLKEEYQILEQNSTTDAYTFANQIKESDNLMNKIIQYGWFEENDNKRQARIEFFPSEARELIYQLLAYIILLNAREGIDIRDFHYYEEIKAQHEAIKQGDFQLKPILTKRQAYNLYEMRSVGYMYVVRFKDGSLWYVDHGYTELIKSEERWEDKNPEWNDCVFEKCKMKLDFIKWEDEKPTDIDEILTVNGFMKNGVFVE